MTLKHLRELLARIAAKDERREIEVWLPGWKISLHGEVLDHPDGSLVIEGMMKPVGAPLANKTTIAPELPEEDDAA